jgi:hypothetical protein
MMTWSCSAKLMVFSVVGMNMSLTVFYLGTTVLYASATQDDIYFDHSKRVASCAERIFDLAAKRREEKL